MCSLNCIAWNKAISVGQPLPIPNLSIFLCPGSVVLIHGQVVHRSAENTSEDSRHVYAFHVMESQDTHWSPDNWWEFLCCLYLFLG